MSYRYLNHLTAIDKAVQTKPKNVAFKVPAESKSTNGWRDITFQELWNDVTRLAVHWSGSLDRFVADGKKGRVVGLWMPGETYTDVLHMFSLQRAGYIPRLMWTGTEDVDLIKDQFEEANAKVVICDTKRVQGWEELRKAGIKVVPFLTREEILELAGRSSSMVDQSVLPYLDGSGDGDDILFITQSSGSSSGRPTVIPFTRRWMDANAQKCQIDEYRTPVVLRTGSFCNAAQILRALRTFLYADCIVLTPKLGWEANELANIIIECGVTNIALYPALVDDILEKAKTSSLLAETLRTLKNITFVGGSLGARGFKSAEEMGIKIDAKVGPTMGFQPVVREQGPRLLKFYRNFDYEFIPFKDGSDVNTKLHELIVLPNSPDCPVPDFLDPIDGKYHTKDLFEIVEDGYIFRGRTNDSITLDNTALCDAKYIEDQISCLCHDLLSSFVVVGQGRPCPALLAEPRYQSDITSTTFRKTLLTRLEPLNSSKFMGYRRERIKPEYVIILSKGSLPISPGKGAVVRSKAELMFEEMLDKVYAGDLHHILGTAIAFSNSSDRLAAYLTKKINGIRETGMKSGVMLPAMVIAPAGLLVYGFTAQRDLHWFGYFAGVAMTNWGAYFYFSFTLAYAVDSYYANTSEMLIAMNLGKQAISFGMGLFLLDWVLQDGYAVVIAGVFVGVLLFNNFLLLVFMFFGKKIRILTNHTWLRNMHRQSAKKGDVL
ncbi:hypothetical protein Clacol_003168 [Clathrus columnatus]|uniref:AMP-dependent synthetase/ligase domain-containing protein n=1 Tax=Clathrus columnatus TaxID=1419009 RepID=A0AAV5A6U4_9AGAM|nr:hypothetical protein Clacol_003168 [Clathrus columnatus]